ncbi:transposase, partial [Candidatus Woesearchaeota archaeon]|nr:transposase [Candidatus Woesearchaeota archaeon]
GIDMSPSKFGVRSDGVEMEMPKEIDISLKKLKKAHRNLSRKKKGGKRRFKARKLLQKRYWRLDNQKVNFYHQTSFKLAKECKVIGIEDLSIKGMMMGYYNAKNFQKSGWSTFINKYLVYKAESAGCQIWKCDRFEPTTRRCSCCGEINPIRLELKDRIFKCPYCDLVLDRDVNASKNIIKYCKAGTVFRGADSPTLGKEQESVLKREKRGLSSEAPFVRWGSSHILYHIGHYA